MENRIKVVAQSFRNGRCFDQEFLIENELLNIKLVFDNLIGQFSLNSFNPSFTIDDLYNKTKEEMERFKLDYSRDDIDSIVKEIQIYRKWWYLTAKKFDIELKELKPLIKKEGLIKPTSFEGCFFYWWKNELSEFKDNVFAPTKKLIIDYLRSEKDKFASNLEGVADLKVIEPAMLKVKTHKIALLEELGIIELLSERLKKNNIHSFTKLGQLVAEIIGDTESSSTIGDYVRGLRIYNKSNDALSKNSAIAVRQVLDKVNLHVENEKLKKHLRE